MKVLHCLNRFLPDQIGGTEVYTYSLITALEKKNIHLKVVIPNYNKTTNEEYETGNVKVIKYAEPSILDSSIMMGKIQPMGLKEFLAIVQNEKPDIVHFHELAGSNGITLHHVKAVKNSGYKVIMTFHLAGYSCKTGSLMYKDKELCDGIIRIKRCSACCYHLKENSELFSKLLTPLSMLFFKMRLDTTLLNNKAGTALGFPFIIKKLRGHLLELIENCDQVVALTHWYKDILIKNGIEANKIATITQGLPEHLNGMSQKSHPFKNGWNESEKSNTLRLVFIGRLSYVKGIHLLIEAIRHLPGNMISLDIYGQVNENGYATNCVEQSKGLKNIHWKGILSPPEVVNTLSQYDVLCLPSAFSEMSPLVIQEAFAAGIPVIASDVYGNAEQIKDGQNGWLFKFKSSDDLKLKLQYIIEHPENIIAAKKKLPASKSFSVIANEYEELYKKITAQ